MGRRGHESRSRPVHGMRHACVPWLLGLLLCGVHPGLLDRVQADDARVEHYLPFPAGFTCTMCQGNNQGSHTSKWAKYAYDFNVKMGTQIIASADGVVKKVREDQEGPTGDPKDNNWVEIEHADGVWSVYHHIKKNGAVVDVGDVVMQGDLIAYSGNSGNSSGPHLHYGLRHDQVSIECRFVDAGGGSVLKNGDKVTSKNASRRPILRHFEDLQARYDAARVMCCRETLKPLVEGLRKKNPPPDAAALLADLGRFRDYHALYEELEAAFLERCDVDALDTLTAIRRHRDAGEIHDAALLASLGRYEFWEPTLRKAFKNQLVELSKLEAYKEHRAAIGKRLAHRKKLMQVFRREDQIEDLAARGRAKPGHWRGLLSRLSDLQSSAPTPEIAAQIEKRMQAIEARASGSGGK